MQVYKCLLLTCDPQVSVACISSPYRGETRGGHLTTAYTIQHIKHIIIIVLLYVRTYIHIQVEVHSIHH